MLHYCCLVIFCSSTRPAELLCLVSTRQAPLSLLSLLLDNHSQDSSCSWPYTFGTMLYTATPNTTLLPRPLLCHCHCPDMHHYLKIYHHITACPFLLNGSTDYRSVGDVFVIFPGAGGFMILSIQNHGTYKTCSLCCSDLPNAHIFL